MKPFSYLGLSLLVWSLTAGEAFAVDIQCVFAGGIGFEPANPGPNDSVTYQVQLGPGQPNKPPPFLVLTNTIVGGGNQVEIDVVVTNDRSPFPGYDIADPTPRAVTGQAVFGGLLGVLPVGQYTGTVSIGVYDSATGILQNTCGGPWSWQLTVSDQPGPTATAEVVEFNYARLNRFFITQDADEIAALDSGLIEGWGRTGQRFTAYLPGQSDRRGFPIRRYYRSPTAAHLFTQIDSEELYLSLGPDRDAWERETLDAFEVPVPNIVSGACVTGTVPVYRLWDGRADSDHRYTTDRNIKQQMIDQGYIPEGFGPDAVFWCALVP
jgi:hypothetical protein